MIKEKQFFNEIKMILERSIELGVYNSDLILLEPYDSNTLITYNISQQTKWRLNW